MHARELASSSSDSTIEDELDDEVGRSDVAEALPTPGAADGGAHVSFGRPLVLSMLSMLSDRRFLLSVDNRAPS